MVFFMKQYEGKVVNLSIYDVFGGIAEFIADKGDEIEVQWIMGSPCYDCQSYSSDMYIIPQTYEKSIVADISEYEDMSEDEIKETRAVSISNDMMVFKRFRENAITKIRDAYESNNETLESLEEKEDTFEEGYRNGIDFTLKSLGIKL